MNFVSKIKSVLFLFATFSTATLSPVASGAGGEPDILDDFDTIVAKFSKVIPTDDLKDMYTLSPFGAKVIFSARFLTRLFTLSGADLDSDRGVCLEARKCMKSQHKLFTGLCERDGSDIASVAKSLSGGPKLMPRIDMLVHKTIMRLLARFANHCEYANTEAKAAIAADLFVGADSSIDRDLVIAYYKRIDKFHTEDIGRGLRAKDAQIGRAHV